MKKETTKKAEKAKKAPEESLTEESTDILEGADEDEIEENEDEEIEEDEDYDEDYEEYDEDEIDEDDFINDDPIPLPDVQGDGEDMNAFTFCGAVVTKYVNKNSVMLTLALNTNYGARGTSNYPRIHIYDEEARKKAASIKKYDRVTVKGYIATYKEPKPGFSPQSFIGTEVEDTKTALSKFGDINLNEMAGTLVRSMNEVVIRGKILRTYLGKGNSMVFEIVAMRDGNHPKRIRVTWFPRESVDKVIGLLKPGNRILVVGRCSTTDKEMPDGKRRHFESIIASVIAPLADSKKKRKKK